MIGSRRSILNSTSTNLVGDGVTLIDQSKIVLRSCLDILFDIFPLIYLLMQTLFHIIILWFEKDCLILW